jgi:penicillin-binding protein 2
VRALVASFVVLCAFALLASRLVYLQVRHADLDEQAEQPHGGGTHRAQPRADSGPQRHRAGYHHSAYTLEITPSKIANLTKPSPH